jgi:hypothetical protein
MALYRILNLMATLSTFPRSTAPFGDVAPITSEIEQVQARHAFGRLAPTLGFGFAAGGLFTRTQLQDWTCAMLILVVTLIPVHAWATRRIRGMPIWPVVSFLSFLVYGMPFLAGHPFTATYSFEEKLTAAATIAGVTLIVTAIWYFMAANRPLTLRMAKVIPTGTGTRFFLASIGMAVAFQVNALFWYVNIPTEAFGVVRAILLSFAMIAHFCLGYDMGSGRTTMTQGQKYAFVVLATTYALANMLSLYLYVAMQVVFLTFLGYFLGGGKPPWKTILVVALTFSLLQAGKASQRATYWESDSQPITSITQTVGFFSEWFTEGFNTLFLDSNPTADTLLERGSVTQLVLKTQTEAPQTVPFLDGSTYLAIPGLMVPRFFWPERPSTQDTLRELSLHYGLMAEGDSVTIGWGLIAEAFANFGYLGVAGLAIVLGLALGHVQRVCGRYPIRSARGLFALMVLFCMVNIEANSASLLATLMQSTVALIVLTFFVMQERRIAG